MPQYHHNIPCLTHAELTDGIVSPDNYKKMVQRGKLSVVRRGCNNTPALIKFPTMCDKTNKAIIDKYGDIRADMPRVYVVSKIQTDYNAHKYYANYLLADGRYLPTDVQEKYVATAQMINTIILIVNDRNALIKALQGNAKHVWPKMSKIISEIKTETGHVLPENPRRLKEKVEQYKKDGYECLISGKFLNKNSTKIKDMEQEALLRQLIGKNNNLDNAQIMELYNIVAQKLEWQKITGQAISNYKEKWQLLTHGGRKGENSFDNTKAMLIKRKAPVLPLVYWTADGWDVELLYQKTELNAKGQTLTTYHNRLTIVVVLDPCEKYPIGYAIGTHETPSLIREAFRNAINHTEIIFGKKHKVLQLQTDNYSNGGLKPFYQALSDKYTPARVGNAKSKIIEPYFAYINKKYCQLMPNWSGFGLTARKENQPNGQYLNKIRHSFPDEAGCRKQIESIIAAERKLRLEKYLIAYKELPEDDKIFINDMEYFQYLTETKEKTTRLSATGIVFQLNKQDYEYDTFDSKFRHHAHIDWTIKYDPSDMTKVLAMNEDGSLKFMLHEKHVQPMALYDRTEEDTLKLQEVRSFNKSLKENIIKANTEDIKHVNELLQRPELEGTLTKFLLCDSNGQHKNNKSTERLKANTQKVIQKQEQKGLKEAQKTWEEKQEKYLLDKIDITKYQ